jgi:hypothetical protein
MTPNISITLNTPHVTIERYSELTSVYRRMTNGVSGTEKCRNEVID